MITKTVLSQLPVKYCSTREIYLSLLSNYKTVLPSYLYVVYAAKNAN